VRTYRQYSLARKEQGSKVTKEDGGGQESRRAGSRSLLNNACPGTHASRGGKGVTRGGGEKNRETVGRVLQPGRQSLVLSKKSEGEKKGEKTGAEPRRLAFGGGREVRGKRRHEGRSSS